MERFTFVRGVRIVLWPTLRDRRVAEHSLKVLVPRSGGDMNRGSRSRVTGEGARDGSLMLPSLDATSDGSSDRRGDCATAQSACSFPRKPILASQRNLLGWRGAVREEPLGHAVGQRDRCDGVAILGGGTMQ